MAVGPAGHIGRYRKLHLFDALGWRESGQVVAGDPLADELWPSPSVAWSVGVMTCYDLRFPEVARALVDRGDPPGRVGPLRGRPRKTEDLDHPAPGPGHREHGLPGGGGKPGPECTGYSGVFDPIGVVLATLDETRGNGRSPKCRPSGCRGARRHPGAGEAALRGACQELNGSTVPKVPVTPKAVGLGTPDLAPIDQEEPP